MTKPADEIINFLNWLNTVDRIRVEKWMVQDSTTYEFVEQSQVYLRLYSDDEPYATGSSNLIALKKAWKRYIKEYPDE